MADRLATVGEHTDLDPEVWGEAFERVEHHLLAWRVRNRFLLTRLAVLILEAAARRRAAEPHRDPAELAAEETEHLLRAWIDQLVGETPEAPARRFARGRAAIYLADLPTRWPASFFSFRDAPPEVAAQVRATYLEAGPDLEFSNMVPRHIDLGPISTVAGGTWKTFAKWPVLRGAVIWSLFATLLGTAFYLTRF